MWDMRRNLNPNPLPKRRVVVEFLYPELPSSKRQWWLVIEPDGEVDLCWSDPGFGIDLYVATSLRAMTAIWMGLRTVEQERSSMDFNGDRENSKGHAELARIESLAIQQKLVS